MRTNWKTRRGMSMAEVLVALFLLALGTIAILTMFPLGMYRMGQALKDDRTSQCAQQADAYMRTYWRNTIELPNPLSEPFFQSLSDPDPTANPFPRGTPAIPSNSNGPSYPVFVDPMGMMAPWTAGNQQVWVGGVAPNYPFLPRRNLRQLTTLASNASFRACSMMDGFGFDESGAPSFSGGAVERELRYNWMWVLQRPGNSVPNTATMTVVVFDKRAFQYVPPNMEQVYVSNGVSAPLAAITMQPLSTVISIPTAVGVPPVQKGGWIMDATPSLKHAIFYRVVSVTDTGVSTDLEIQTPIRRLDGSTGQYNGTLVFFAGASEVFERPNLTPNDF